MARRFDEIEDDELTPEMLLLRNDDEDDEPARSKIKKRKTKKPVKHKNSVVDRNADSKILPDAKEISPDQLFNLALRDFRKGNYAEVVNYLTPFVEDQPAHVLAHKILAYALIETGFSEDASRIIGRVLTLNRNDAEALNIRAYLELKSGNLQLAINDLLDALYVDEEHPVLKHNLDRIRSLKDAKLVSTLLKPKDFIFLTLPEETLWNKVNFWAMQVFSSPFLKFLTLLILLGVIGLIFYANYPTFSNWLSHYRTKRGFASREFKRVSIKDIDQLVAERKPGKLFFTADGVKKTFSQMREQLRKRHYNRSRFLMNKLLFSNASEKVKEHVRIFEGFLPDVTMESLDFVPAYADVAKAPMLYKGLFIRWSGTIANLDHVKREETVFDLLINFVDEAVVEGIGEIHFKGFVHLINGDKITVFGKIAGLTMDNKVVIKGRQALRLGKK